MANPNYYELPGSRGSRIAYSLADPSRQPQRTGRDRPMPAPGDTGDLAIGQNNASATVNARMSSNKHVAILVFLVLFAEAAVAHAGGDINAVVSHDFPGWKIYQQETGDLDLDGKADIAAILWKPAPEGTDQD